MRTITFPYQGKQFEFTFRESGIPLRSPNGNLKYLIGCQHPIFIEAFGSPTVTASTIGGLFDRGKSANPEFFSSMESAFRR